MVDLIALANAVLNGKPAEDCSSTKTDRCAGSAATGPGSNNPATTIRIKKARPRIECHRLLGGLHCRVLPALQAMIAGQSSVRKVRFGSKGEILIRSRCFPLYTRKRTQVGHRAMSVSCQQATSA